MAALPTAYRDTPDIDTAPHRLTIMGHYYRFVSYLAYFAPFLSLKYGRAEIFCVNFVLLISFNAYFAPIMAYKIDFSVSSSTAIAAALCKRLEEIRLSQNISQADLAREAGVSRRTLTRMADGETISLDSFIRISKALGLAEHLAALLPDPTVRPVELVANEGKQRRRASGKRKAVEPWSWGDADGGS